MVTVIYNRAGIGALYRRIVIDGMNPHVQKHIHLRAFAHADKFMDFGDWEKEKAVILLAGEIVFQYSIVFGPVCYLELYDLFILQKRVSDVVLFLQIIQDRNCLMLETAPELCAQICQGADPFPRSYKVSHSFCTTVGLPVICIRTKDDVIKKKRASVCPDALVSD